MSLSIKRIARALGAEINNIDLSQKLSDHTIGELRQALLEYKVIFFHKQQITPHEHLAFAKRFGDIVKYPMVKGLEGLPEIIPVVKLPHETVNFGGMWHSDTTYTQCPPMGSILAARALPPFGGNTQWNEGPNKRPYRRLFISKKRGNKIAEKSHGYRC